MSLKFCFCPHFSRMNHIRLSSNYYSTSNIEKRWLRLLQNHVHVLSSQPWNPLHYGYCKKGKIAILGLLSHKRTGRTLWRCGDRRMGRSVHGCLGEMLRKRRRKTREGIGREERKRVKIRKGNEKKERLWKIERRRNTGSQCSVLGNWLFSEGPYSFLK